MLRIALFVLASTGVALAQVDNILANIGTFKPKITLSDHYSEAVLVEVDDGDVYRSVVANPESIALTVVANLDGASVGAINANTSIGVTAWHFDHSATLGDSLDYKPGLTRATFPLTKDVELPSGDIRIARVGTITYVWTAKTLTATVVCTDIEGAGVGDIAASDYIAIAAAGTSVKIANDPVDVSISFGNAVGSRRAFLKGISKTALRKYGSVAAGTYEEFELCDVTLQGLADLLGPVVKATFPVKPDLANKIAVTGTASDTTDISLDSVTINGVVVPTVGGTATAGITDADDDGVWSWSLSGIVLKKGVNAVVLTFSDEDGNTTKVTKSYTLAK